MAETDDIEAQLSALREKFTVTLSVILDDLEARVVSEASEIVPETLVKLHAGLHRLAGSGGTFGFAALSVAARALEVQTRQWLDEGKELNQEAWSLWRAQLMVLRATVQSPRPLAAVVKAVPVTAPVQQKVGLVFIGEDRDVCSEVALGLGQFGYAVTSYPSVTAARDAILANPPDALLIDILAAYPAELVVGSQVGQQFRQLGHSVPTVFLTGRADFQAKLAAARVGASALLLKPVDVAALADCVEKLLESGNQRPFRILIVDDDEVLAEHYRLTLSVAGMMVRRVSRPADVLAAMNELNPDLVLLDLYMPECTGAELARAIRYDPAWQGLPIIYLSAEANLDLQVAALSSGADDFLTKPISDQQLVATVRVRAARARKVTELMSQDSMTGLLKHASIKDRLAQEVDRARRQNKPLCAVMVDMDHFKRVNDTYGHPMGDQVIKTLALLLRQRLRRQDSIGRYGGEEFAAVLSECTAEDAKRLLDDVRQRFSEIRFSKGDLHFNVTLSVGIACSEAYGDAPSLLAAADGALYVAKHGGRNQVIIAAAPVADSDVGAQQVLRTT